MIHNTQFRAKITRAEIEQLPSKKFNGEIFFIDSFPALDKVMPELLNETLFGFDTETRPAFKKGTSNVVSLMQLSTADKAFLFRLNKIGLTEELCTILGNPVILKAGVAIHDDLGGLKRLKKFIPDGFIDLQDYVKDFGIEDNGLKKLAANILGIRISKRQQTSNWDKDKLSPAQIEYAATDAWVCHEIYHMLHRIKRINGYGD